MSSRKLRLSKEAEEDFDHILLYTGQEWGLKQLEVYFEKIDAALSEIALNPHVGSLLAGFSNDCRRLFVGSHMIVYRTHEGEVQVLRILHQRMHFQGALTQEEYRHQRMLESLAQAEAGMGIPHEEVVAYMMSKETDNPLPRPIPRPIPKRK
jgi:toxin ParE1/3/4